MENILIANRGEIAVRIIRTCKKLGLRTIAVYSEADEGAFHTKVADEAVCIGRWEPDNSYLNIKTILAVAKAYNVSAIHPGVGFLSEIPAFRKSCDEEGIVFIGPDASSIELLGDKQQARLTMIKHNIPVIPGSPGVIKSFKEAEETAEKIGFPVMLKAINGGGGVGIRIVNNMQELMTQYHLAVREAKNAFGNDSLYIESYLQNTRHIEVQILADSYGNTLHFGTRECSLQRKNQKLTEEAPAPFISEETRQSIEESAVKIAKTVGYKNAGTVEFLLTQDEKFYFMEMNTRIQVEHPVTESIYGIDLIQAQIQVAFGHKLILSQKDIFHRGHAIECRINAEKPEEGFRPSPGLITGMDLPGGNGVRVDSGFTSGNKITPFYDSLVMKIICRGDNRKEAIRLSVQALDELDVKGIDTNKEFTKKILQHKDFQQGSIYTKWIEDIFLAKYMENKV